MADQVFRRSFINLKELVGEHLGENLAEIVWGVLTAYKIVEKVASDYCIPFLILINR